jgi:phosphoglycolate phosphatase
VVNLVCGKKQFFNIQAIIFDKDGTLENSFAFQRELGQKRSRLIDAKIPGIGEPLLMAFGIQENRLDPAGLMAVGTRQENEIAAAAYIAETGRSWFEAKIIAKEAFREADQYIQKETQTSPLFPGSLELLKSLSQAGLKLGILSADSTSAVKNFVEKHQLSQYIQFFQGSQLGLTKPDPEIFIQACQALEVEAKATLMVGDSQGDLVMAKQAGAAGAIGICWTKATVNNLDKADVVIYKLEEVRIF